MSKKILVVEDNLTLFETIRGYVDHIYEVSHAETGEEAVSKLSEKPDLVLLDLNLPDIHGLKLIEDIKKTNAKLIVLSGEVSSDTVAEALAKGADHYLAKPVTPIMLKTSIAKILDENAA